MIKGMLCRDDISPGIAVVYYVKSCPYLQETVLVFTIPPQKHSLPSNEPIPF